MKKKLTLFGILHCLATEVPAEIQNALEFIIDKRGPQIVLEEWSEAHCNVREASVVTRLLGAGAFVPKAEAVKLLVPTIKRLLNVSRIKTFPRLSSEIQTVPFDFAVVEWSIVHGTAV